MGLRRTSLLLTLLLAATACGGGVVGVTSPTPTPTSPPPPPGGTGTVTGTAGVAPTALRGAPAANFPARPESRRPANLPTYAPDRLIVKFRRGAQASAKIDLHRQAATSVLSTNDRLDVQVVRVAPGALEAVMRTYRASPLVEYVEQDGYAYKAATPTDPSYPSQWHYPAINLPAAWDTVTGSAATIVAVVDTGTRTAHPDLGGGLFAQGYDFFANPDDADPTDPGCPTVDPNDPSHGMHVAGTIAALTNNGTGVAGVNWGGVAGTRLMAIRVLGEDVGLGLCGIGFTSDVAAAITYAADHGAKIINLSLGGPGSMTLQNAVNYAYGLGVTLVAAAGNDSMDIGASPQYPAAYPNVITVSALACTDAKAFYSNFGSPIDIAAPGGDSTVDCPGGIVGERILSSSWSPNAGYGYWYFQGTSMAAPHVSGVLALMLARLGGGPASLQTALQNTATDLGAPGWDPMFGWGKVNAGAAVSGGASSARLRAFSGITGGTTITRQSDIVEVGSAGAFTITNAQAGASKTVYLHQDLNGNGLVDAGDMFGQTGGITITAGQTTSGVVVTVQRYPGPTLTIN